MRNLLFVFLITISAPLYATEYEVRDDSYTVCTTLPQYQQLLRWSLYGVGDKPASGCFKAPARAKAIILECPEGDMILCRFRLSPLNSKDTIEVWASKAMLKEIP